MKSVLSLKHIKCNKKWNKITCFYVLMFTPYIVTILSHIFMDNVRLEAGTWQVSEILINYQGGFVRRGLIGEAIYHLQQNFGINALLIAYIFSIISALVFFYLIIRDTIKRKFSILFLPTTMLLSSLFVSGHWVRKDFFILLLFYFIVLLLKRQWKIKYLLINMLLIIGILTHEVIFFISLPIIFITVCNETSVVSGKGPVTNLIINTLWCSLYILPSIITLLFVTLFKGDVECATQIWESWQSVGVLSGEMKGAIAAIGWTPEKAIAVGTEVWTTIKCGVYYPFMWAFLAFVAFVIFVWMYRLKPTILGYCAKKDFDISESSYIIVFQFLAMLPLLLVFADTSRAFFYVIMSAYIIRLYDNTYLYSTVLGELNARTKKLLLSIDKFVDKRPKTFAITAFVIGLPSISISALEHIILHGQIGFFVKSIIEIFK